MFLQQFRNYQEQWVRFLAPKTLIVGDNAQGKSNLLEAIAYLSLLKSHRSHRDRDLVRSGATAGYLHAVVERSAGELELGVTLRTNGRRTVAANGTTLRRQYEFLGLLKTVRFSSMDLDLVRGSPAERRHWLDNLLSQLEPLYGHICDRYEKILRQRNALLRGVKLAALQHEAEVRGVPTAELAAWDAQLAAVGARLIQRRSRALNKLAPLAQHWHQTISDGREQLTVTYAPNIPGMETCDRPAIIQQAFLAQLQQKATAERYQGTTLAGPHRDDITFALDGLPAKPYGSQGQQRTLVLALKLAELQWMEAVAGDPPVLLLDDVLAELDPHRQDRLLAVVQGEAGTGGFQTLITATHTEAFDPKWLTAAQILQVRSGQMLETDTGDYSLQ